MTHEVPQPQPDSPPSESLAHEEDELAANLLSKLTGKMSTRLFTEIAGMIPQEIVEIVIFRMNQGVLETLLIPRPEDDRVWPNMYHTPGSAMRNEDFKRADGVPMNGAFNRIQNEELGLEFTRIPMFVGIDDRTSKRGAEAARVFIGEIDPNAQIDIEHMWYPVNRLAENPKFISSQLNHVAMAAEAYVRQQTRFVSNYSEKGVRDYSR